MDNNYRMEIHCLLPSPLYADEIGMEEEEEKGRLQALRVAAAAALY